MHQTEHRLRVRTRAHKHTRTYTHTHTHTHIHKDTKPQTWGYHLLSSIKASLILVMHEPTLFLLKSSAPDTISVSTCHVYVNICKYIGYNYLNQAHQKRYPFRLPCVCKYMSIHIYIIHKLSTYVCMYIYTRCMYVCMYICMYVCMHQKILAPKRTNIHINTNAYICRMEHEDTSKSTHNKDVIRRNTHTYIYKYMHAHTPHGILCASYAHTS